MPLLEIVQTRHVNATIRLDVTSAEQIDQYGAFLHASADEVVDKALAYVFAKDRDFQEFLRTPEAQRITPTLRVRRPPANEPAEPPRRKPVSVASSAASMQAIAAGSKA